MDIAAELGSELITTCPLADGYDYPFQVDHAAAWERFIETVEAVASYRTAKHMGPVAAYGTNLLMVQRMSALLERMGMDQIARLFDQDGNVAETFDYLSSFLGGASQVRRKKYDHVT
jgi:hypothetical protein